MIRKSLLKSFLHWVYSKMEEKLCWKRKLRLELKNLKIRVWKKRLGGRFFMDSVHRSDGFYTTHRTFFIPLEIKLSRKVEFTHAQNSFGYKVFHTKILFYSTAPFTFCNCPLSQLPCSYYKKTQDRYAFEESLVFIHGNRDQKNTGTKIDNKEI